MRKNAIWIGLLVLAVGAGIYIDFNSQAIFPVSLIFVVIGGAVILFNIWRNSS